MRHVDRQTWWSWSEQRRESWVKWFKEHGHSDDDIAEFWVYEDERTVMARVFIDLPNSADAEMVDISGGSLPPYH